MRSRALVSGLAGWLASLVLTASPAAAIVHLWDIAEIYSNADGSVQFIELFTDGPFEIAWSEASIRSEANDTTVAFDENLAPPTTNRSVLLATPGFAALPGAVTPDYEIPAGFFDPAGDTLEFTVGIDRVTFATGQLPLDGLTSLHRMLELPSPQQPTEAGPDDLFAALNSPTNSAGQAGSLVPEPGTALLLAAGLLALGGRRAPRPAA